MSHGLKFDDIKICGDLVIDGHHRYISSLLANKDCGTVFTNRTSATRTYDWSEVKFVENEWDTPEKINKLNKDDAEFNGMPLKDIQQMTE